MCKNICLCPKVIKFLDKMDILFIFFFVCKMKINQIIFTEALHVLKTYFDIKIKAMFFNLTTAFSCLKIHIIRFKRNLNLRL